MKPRVNLRLDGALLAQLEAAARAQKTTKTDILEQALRCAAILIRTAIARWRTG